jgi:succinate-semialdehyde dehydrogenase/glutarate-semialdehyde dehydrogenase
MSIFFIRQWSKNCHITERTTAYLSHSKARNCCLYTASRVYYHWRMVSFGECAAVMHQVAHSLRLRKAHLANLITAEMGKPVTEAEAEVEKCAWNCE